MAESEQAKELIQFLQTKLGVKKIRFPATSSIGIAGVARRHRAAGAQGPAVRHRQ